MLAVANKPTSRKKSWYAIIIGAGVIGTLASRGKKRAVGRHLTRSGHYGPQEPPIWVRALTWQSVIWLPLRMIRNRPKEITQYSPSSRRFILPEHRESPLGIRTCLLSLVIFNSKTNIKKSS